MKGTPTCTSQAHSSRQDKPRSGAASGGGAASSVSGICGSGAGTGPASTRAGGGPASLRLLLVLVTTLEFGAAPPMYEERACSGKQPPTAETLTPRTRADRGDEPARGRRKRRPTRRNDGHPSISS